MSKVKNYFLDIKNISPAVEDVWHFVEDMKDWPLGIYYLSVKGEKNDKIEVSFGPHDISLEQIQEYLKSKGVETANPVVKKNTWQGILLAIILSPIWVPVLTVVILKDKFKKK
jgi:hypothetical protein